MEKTGAHAIPKNADHRRDGFKCLKIMEKDQVLADLLVAVGNTAWSEAVA